MKRFLLYILIFIVAFITIDQSMGLFMRYLVVHGKGGDTALNNYICNETIDECLIFGSSRAMHHYDPTILSDSLKMSCWNCGYDGNGIILMYGRYRMISSRYTPKVIVYDIEPKYDLMKGDNQVYLGCLKYYYNNDGIDTIFWNVDMAERYKMAFKCYQYNTRWLQLISDNIHPLADSKRGYRPMDLKMNYEPKAEKDLTYCNVDSLKIYYLTRLITECKISGTKLIFTISPKYKSTSDQIFSPIKELCVKYRVPLINYYLDDEFRTNKNFFYDSFHMNREGATSYSKKIAHSLRSAININKGK